MWSFTVVVRHPLRKDRPKMPLVERNHPIETLAPRGPNEAFTVRVRLRGTYRRLQHLERHRTKGLVHGRREDAVTVIDEEPVGPVRRKAVPKLLDGPLRRGVLGESPVDDSSCGDVEDDEDVQA
jgi:hypothetical protein